MNINIASLEYILFTNKDKSIFERENFLQNNEKEFFISLNWALDIIN